MTKAIGVRIAFAAAAMIATSTPAWSKVQSKLINVPSGHQIHYELTPAAPGHPTQVLLNGLPWSTRSCDSYVRYADDGVTGILRVDNVGMGRTSVGKTLTRPFPIADQARDLHALLENLGISKPVLVGLSYGGGLALQYAGMYPNDVSQVVLLAPFTARWRKADIFIGEMIRKIRQNPFHAGNAYNDEALHDGLLRWMLWTSAWREESGTYLTPGLWPWSAIANYSHHTQNMFYLSKGIQDFDAHAWAPRFPDAAMHLVVGTADELIEMDDFNAFWSALPVAKRGSYTKIIGARHKLPGHAELPELTARIVKAIINKEPGFTGGATTWLTQSGLKVDPDSRAARASSCALRFSSP